MGIKTLFPLFTRTYFSKMVWKSYLLCSTRKYLVLYVLVFYGAMKGVFLLPCPFFPIILKFYNIFFYKIPSYTYNISFFSIFWNSSHISIFLSNSHVCDMRWSKILLDIRLILIFRFNLYKYYLFINSNILLKLSIINSCICLGYKTIS